MPVFKQITEISLIFRPDEQGAKILLGFKKMCSILRLSDEQSTKLEPDQCFRNKGRLPKKSKVLKGILFLITNQGLPLLDNDVIDVYHGGE